MRLIQLSENDYQMFDNEITSTEYEFFQRHKDVFRRMWTEQGTTFWVRFVITFRAFSYKYGTIKDMPGRLDQYEEFIDQAFQLINEHFVEGRFGMARNFVLDILICAQHKGSIQYLESKSYSKDPFYTKETREIYRRFFGPPNEKLSYVKVYCLMPLYLKFGSSVCSCIRRWMDARETSPADDSSYWTPPDAIEKTKKKKKSEPVEMNLATEDLIYYYKEIKKGAKHGPQFLLPIWEDGDPRFNDPENPLYDPNACPDCDWRKNMNLESFKKFRRYVEKKYGKFWEKMKSELKTDLRDEEVQAIYEKVAKDLQEKKGVSAKTKKKTKLEPFCNGKCTIDEKKPDKSKEQKSSPKQDEKKKTNKKSKKTEPGSRCFQYVNGQLLELSREYPHVATPVYPHLSNLDAYDNLGRDQIHRMVQKLCNEQSDAVESSDDREIMHNIMQMTGFKYNPPLLQEMDEKEYDVYDSNENDSADDEEEDLKFLDIGTIVVTPKDAPDPPLKPMPTPLMLEHNLLGDDYPDLGVHMSKRVDEKKGTTEITFEKDLDKNPYYCKAKEVIQSVWDSKKVPEPKPDPKGGLDLQPEVAEQLAQYLQAVDVDIPSKGHTAVFSRSEPQAKTFKKDNGLNVTFTFNADDKNPTNSEGKQAFTEAVSDIMKGNMYSGCPELPKELLNRVEQSSKKAKLKERLRQKHNQKEQAKIEKDRFAIEEEMDEMKKRQAVLAEAEKKFKEEQKKKKRERQKEKKNQEKQGEHRSSDSSPDKAKTQSNDSTEKSNGSAVKSTGPVETSTSSAKTPNGSADKSNGLAAKSNDSPATSTGSTETSNGSAEKSTDSAEKANGCPEKSTGSAEKSKDLAEKSKDSAEKSSGSADKNGIKDEKINGNSSKNGTKKKTSNGSAEKSSGSAEKSSGSIEKNGGKDDKINGDSSKNGTKKKKVRSDEESDSTGSADEKYVSLLAEKFKSRIERDLPGADCQVIGSGVVKPKSSKKGSVKKEGADVTSDPLQSTKGEIIEGVDSRRRRVCNNCGMKEPKPKIYKKCQKCKELGISSARYYCGRECQVNDWKEKHKQEHKENLLV